MNPSSPLDPPAPAPPALSAWAPGRICLFGDHADYLGLGVIAAAIDLGIRVEAWPLPGTEWTVSLPDVGDAQSLDPNQPLPYRRPRDYLRAAARVLGLAGCRWPRAFRCRLTGDLPISSGVSSSSALVIAWTRLLLAAAEPESRQRALGAIAGPLGTGPAGVSAAPEGIDPADLAIAHWGYQAEVLEFGEPGGMMDQFSSSLGGLLYIDCAPPLRPRPLQGRPLAGFVLADSLEPKDTMAVLSRARGAVEEGLAGLAARGRPLDLRQDPPEGAEEQLAALPAAQAQALRAQLGNWRITRAARQAIESGGLTDDRLGSLLNEHHAWLRDGLGVSTPRLEALIGSALAAGALGAKVTGSGGGGCLIAYAPGRQEAVADALRRAGAKAWLLSPLGRSAS